MPYSATFRKEPVDIIYYEKAAPKPKPSSETTITHKEPAIREKPPPRRQIEREAEQISVQILTPDSQRLEVPPTTPAPHLEFGLCHPRVKLSSLPPLDFRIPYVREIGVKACIDTLGALLKFENPKLNLAEFWVLDVLTDCVWQMQDEYRFPEQYQRIILEWILYALKLIQDPHKSLSRREFFQIFNEALLIASEEIQSGCEFLPPPDNLFLLIENDEDEKISFSSVSSDQSSSVSLMSDGTEGSYVVMGIDESPEIFKLPKRTLPSPDNEIENFIETECIELGPEEKESSNQITEFYQPELNTPERFRSLSSSSPISLLEEENPMHLNEGIFQWESASAARIPGRACSQISLKSKDNAAGTKSQNTLIEEWQSYLEGRKEYVDTMEKHILVNSCALYMIKQFIYDYFYETFQYGIAKFSLMNEFTSITETINKTWNEPKILKKALKKPKIKKPKKKKAKKQKPKKKTKAKKKPKKKKPKKKSKGTKKKDRKKKLTKEEKAEIARRKREQKLLEEQLRIAEENRRLLLPLKDATNDEFFMSIFEHWSKPKKRDRKKKKKSPKLK